MSNPSVTWSLAVKNGMPFLPETLASIQNQTCQDFEILVWLNGSDDGTLEELKRWIPDRIPGKIVSDNPLTFAGAKSAIISQARTEFVANIDADDLCRPDRLERQLQLMRSDPRLAAISSHFQRIDEAGAAIKKPSRLPLHHEDIVNRLLKPSPLCNPAALLRREMVLEVGNIRQFEIGEDYNLWMRLAVSHRLGNVDSVGIDYRIRPDSMIRRVRQEGRYEELVSKVAEAAPIELFGLPSQDLRNLFLRRVNFAWPLIRRIANHLDETQPGRTRLRSRSFLNAIDELVAKEDVRTRATLAALRVVAR